MNRAVEDLRHDFLCSQWHLPEGKWLNLGSNHDTMNKSSAREGQGRFLFMICKWCGAGLRDGATKCSRCSKSVPAKSDCGGFYDLIVNPPQTVAEVQTKSSVAETPAVEVISSMGAGRGRRQETKRSPLIPLGINLGVLAVVLVLLMGLNSKLNQYEQTINRHEAKIAELELQPTQPEEEESILLEEQDAKVTVLVGQGENGLDASVDQFDLGKYIGSFSARVDRSVPQEPVISLDLDDTQDCANIKIIHTTGDEQTPGRLAVDFAVSPEMFALMDDEPEWKWEYRFSEDEAWQILQPAVEQPSVEQTEDVTEPAEETAPAEADQEQPVPFALFHLGEDGALEYRRDDWFAQWNHLNSVEFRLTYTRNNVKGGSLEIVLDGLSVEKPLLEVDKPVSQEHEAVENLGE